MSFTIKERIEGSGGIRKNGTTISFTSRVTYVVISTDRNATREQVLAISGLPLVGISVAANGATCEGKDAKRDAKNPHVWEVTCEFSTGQAVQEQDPGAPSDDPVTWIPIWTGSLETTEEVTDVDADGTPIRNSAGQRFAEPMMRTRNVAVSKFSQFEVKTTPLKTILDRNECVNSGAVTTARFGTFEPKTLLLLVDGYEYGFFGGYECWKVDYTCKYKRRTVPAAGAVYKDAGTTLASGVVLGWREAVIDHGWYNSSNSPCLDVNKRPMDALLSGGVQKAVGAIPDMLVYDRYKPISFAFIRLRA